MNSSIEHRKALGLLSETPQLNLDTVYHPDISAFDKLETLRFASQQLQSKIESLSVQPSMNSRIATALEAYSQLARDWDSLCEDANESYDSERRHSEELIQGKLERIRAEKEREEKRRRELAVRAVSMEMKEKEFSKSLKHLLSLSNADVDLLDEMVQAHRHNREKLSDAANSELAELDKELKLVLAPEVGKDLPKPVNDSQIDISMMNESQVNAAFDKAMDDLAEPEETNEVSGWVSELESDKEEGIVSEVPKQRRPLDMLKDPELEGLPRQMFGSKPTFLENSSFEVSKGASIRTLTPEDSRNFNAPRPILKKPSFIVTSPRSAVLAELEKTSARSGRQFLKIEEMTDSWTKDSSSSIKPIQSPQSEISSIRKKASHANSIDYHSTDSTRSSGSSRSKWKPPKEYF